MRIPTLDGWRGVAVLLVLIFHFQMYFAHDLLRFPWAWCGEHGVTIFFVVSGFLITSNLLRNDDLKRFYVRRFFRLMPAAWAYLAVVSILAAFTSRVTIGNDLWGCVFFYRNFLDTKGVGTFTGHFWSLSIEEQFYFAWPFALFFLRKRAVWFASGGALSVAGYRLLVHPEWMAQGYDLHFRTFARIDAIMVGCVLAFAMKHDWITQCLTRQTFWASFAVFAFDLWRYQSIPPLHENIAIALMVACTVTNPKLIASRILELPHLKTTGVLCYGIYLWQGLFLRATFGFFGVFLLPVAVALSWALIEKPSQRIADWILNRHSCQLETA